MRNVEKQGLRRKSRDPVFCGGHIKKHLNIDFYMDVLYDNG